MRDDFIFECRLSYWRGDFVASMHSWLSRRRSPAVHLHDLPSKSHASAGVETNKQHTNKRPLETRWSRYAPTNTGLLDHRGIDVMEIGETIYVTTSDEFRKWLLKNHRTKKEIWLVQYKKATKKPSINYVDAVEEALCFGWIDGLEKSMDAERYALRFSPRRPKSNWTNTNKERARKMIAEGRMTPAGRAALPPDVIK